MEVFEYSKQNMQGIEYHNDTSNNGNGYQPLLSPPALPQIHGEPGLQASLNGRNRQYDDNSYSSYHDDGRAYESLTSTYGDNIARDRPMVDMGGYNNGGGCDGSTEAWWTRADKSNTSVNTIAPTTSATKTSLGPGPPAEANGIDKPYYESSEHYNSTAADQGARASFINSSSGGTCANKYNFDGLANSYNRCERIAGLTSDSGGDPSYGSDGFGNVDVNATHVNTDGNYRIVSDGRNEHNNKISSISSSNSGSNSSIGIRNISTVAVGSDLSSSLSSSLSLLPTPPSTATGGESFGFSGGPAGRFGENQIHNQIQHQQHSLLQQALRHQTQHTQDGQQQQVHLSHSSAHNAHSFQAQQQQQQQYEQEAQHHNTRQIAQESQQTEQGQHSQITNGTAQGQDMAPSAQTGVMSTTNDIPAKSAISVACMWCRSKHLKCDGGVRCSRCQAEGLICSYPKSRRGFKGPRKAKALLSARRHDSLTQGQADPGALAQPAQSLVTQEGGLTSPISPLTADNYLNTELVSVSNSLDLTLADARLSVDIIEKMPLFLTMPHLITTQMKDPSFTHAVSNSVNSVTTYYAFYHSAHPFLLPRDRLQRLLRERKLPHLELAIQFIASCFNPRAPTAWFQEAADRLLVQSDPPKTGFTVQALLLFALASHANSNPEGGLRIMATAINMALELGMNRRDFAINNGEGDVVLEESWRRTWWELFVVDGMFAAVTQKTNFWLNSIHSDVPLPCEEVEYQSGNIPLTRTLEDYDNSAFDSEETVFSSYTYRIDAIRILGKILPITDPDVMDYHAQDIADASLTNWHLHLPACKKEIIGKGLEVDEILFQAHMVINGATIHLHRPRSYLSAREVNAVTTCVNPEQCLLPSQAYETHTAKAIRAAEAISKLVTLPAPISRRTPMFTCVITMSSIVHLAYWSFFIADGEDALVKEQIRLNVGGLKTLANYWPVAKVVLGQVRGVAQEMFKAKRRTAPASFVDYVIGDEMLKGMIEDVGGVESIAVGSF